MSVRVTVNGSPATLPDGAGIVDAVAAAGASPDSRGIAVALDGEVVPRSAWERTGLSEGQVVEVVAAVQGG